MTILHSDSSDFGTLAHINASDKCILELWNAFIFAQRVGKDRWQYAVELEQLLRHGIEISSLRWKVDAKIIEHRLEISDPQSSERNFQTVDSLRFEKNSCFVLTDRGLRNTEYMLPTYDQERSPKNPLRVLKVRLPRWDEKLRALFLGETLIKEYKTPASNQELILEVLEEEKWPEEGILDPIPTTPQIDPKKRLRETVKCLNRRHRTSDLLRFNVDRIGERIHWKVVG